MAATAAQKGAPDDVNGGYAVLKNPPTASTGYDTTRQDDYNVTHAQRAWTRRGAESIVSVTVVRAVKKGDTGPSPRLPVSASELTLKVAQR
ncbi:hypothetical protein ABCR94_16300 [Streptomyces sp. 21So2-11]|uniref:hypothetical protein n=1 Tax=Streptomyces sp. 21So2-11 TaxID=3144408 RepID=UPI00321AFB27